jgi:chemotaxis protein CheD
MVKVPKFRPVPIGEIIASTDPDDVLVVYGVGSCVVVGLYDPVTRVGGILHALLPGLSWQHQHVTGKPTKYVDQGVPLLVEVMTSLGAKKNRLIVCLCGGAQVINAPGFSDSFSIGQRNIVAARLALQNAGLDVKSEMTGGRAGSSIRLHIANGKVTVKTLGQEERILNGNGAKSTNFNISEGIRRWQKQ